MKILMGALLVAAGWLAIAWVPLACSVDETIATEPMGTDAGRDAGTPSDGGREASDSSYTSICESGVCPSPGRSVVELARTDRPIALATDDTSVYWVTGCVEEGSSVLKVGSSGGSPVTLAAGSGTPLDGGSNCAWDYCQGGLAVDKTNVYWRQGIAGVMKVSLEGGAPTTVASTEPGPGNATAAIAIDSESVYWGYSLSGDTYAKAVIVKAPLAGGATTTVVNIGQNAPDGLAVGGGSVFWTETEWSPRPVVSAATSGGKPFTLASPDWLATPYVAADHASVYFAESVDTPSFGASAIKSVPISGGPATTLAALDVGQQIVGVIAIDDASLYWMAARQCGGVYSPATSPATLMKVALRGGTVTTLATLTNAPLGALAVDATSVYWGALEGSPSRGVIMKLSPK